MTKTPITRVRLAAMIDHSLLRPEMTDEEVRRGCEVAMRCHVASVCARPCDVPAAARLLAGSGVAVGTVIGFPHGAVPTEIKAAEAHWAVEQGADELDMVLNIGRLRSGDVEFVRQDIAAVVAAAQGRLVKVILECCYLDAAQKAAGCKASQQAGAHFVKTSTGFGSGGATVEDIRFMREQVGTSMGVKAAGGVRTLEAALAMVEAGATRLGATATEAILSALPG